MGIHGDIHGANTGTEQCATQHEQRQGGGCGWQEEEGRKTKTCDQRYKCAAFFIDDSACNWHGDDRTDGEGKKCNAKHTEPCVYANFGQGNVGDPASDQNSVQHKDRHDGVAGGRWIEMHGYPEVI